MAANESLAHDIIAMLAAAIVAFGDQVLAEIIEETA